MLNAPGKTPPSLLFPLSSYIHAQINSARAIYPYVRGDTLDRFTAKMVDELSIKWFCCAEMVDAIHAAMDAHLARRGDGAQSAATAVLVSSTSARAFCSGGCRLAEGVGKAG